MNKTVGLNNLGNTCFLNSGLQMLLLNNDYCKIIIENKSISDNLGIMAKFIEDYKSSNQKSISPDKIKKIVEVRKPIFKGTKQHDSSEFILALMEILNDDLKGKLDEIFKITSKTTIKCKYKTCLKESETNETNNVLILPINDDTENLDDCYRKYKVHELLEGDEMYHCDKCNEKRIASKTLKVESWSNNLIIIIKRFINKNSKNSKDIDIPIDWRHDFTIKGAVFHSGNIGGGHYIYLSKNINGMWTIYDDSSTSEITENKAQGYLNKAYILYYVKKS
jgi:ubiquitin C-terminal hydrolase